MCTFCDSKKLIKELFSLSFRLDCKQFYFQKDFSTQKTSLTYNYDAIKLFF